MIILTKNLGITDYATVFDKMKSFTMSRTAETADELWLTQHKAVFTQGQAGKKEHLINAHGIPVIQSDRGGQITYHAPGQLVLYFLIDIKRRGIGVRQMVSLIEQTVIDTLATYQISSVSRADAPGVYSDNKKVASLGLRVKSGRTYHGVALNVDMNLEPFSYINPCGQQGLQVTQLSNLTLCKIDEVALQLIEQAKVLLVENTSV